MCILNFSRIERNATQGSPSWEALQTMGRLCRGAELCPSQVPASGAVAECIEIFYNRTRMHSSIDFISPAEAEASFENEAAA